MSKSTSKKNIVIISVISAVVIAAVVVILVLYFATDVFAGKEQPPAECEHVYAATESEYDRPATYDEEGRQLMVCSLCGKSYVAVVPRLERAPGTDAPDYRSLLDIPYRVEEGSALGEIAAKFFTPGWSFAADEETVVGAVGTSAEYEVVFRSAEEGYEEVNAVVTLTVVSAE